MSVPTSVFTAAVLFAVAQAVAAAEPFSWPAGQQMAVSLSYDDAIDSQLDTAIPALNKQGLRASFYLTLASPTVMNRLDEWRAAAAQGHELGNHSIFHPCSAGLPGRDWVATYYDIDGYVVAEMVHEVTVANSVLHAIDGRTERTFTPPCGDLMVSDGNYLPAVEDMFLAVKGNEEVAPGFAVIWGPVDVTGEQLIERVKNETEKGTRLLNILFHGVGGDYLSVSSKAHGQLLEFLAEHKSSYWVDSYLNIMKYVEKSRPEDG